MLTLSFSTPDYPLPAFPLVEKLEFLQGASKACLPREALPDTCAASPWTLAVASAIAPTLYQGGSSSSSVPLCTLQGSGRQWGLRPGLQAEPESRQSLHLMPSDPWVPNSSAHPGQQLRPYIHTEGPRVAGLRDHGWAQKKKSKPRWWGTWARSTASENLCADKVLGLDGPRGDGAQGKSPGISRPGFHPLLCGLR